MAKQAILEHQDAQQLMEEHAMLDRRVKELDRRISLSPEEQFELVDLKKRKLALKDRLRESMPPS